MESTWSGLTKREQVGAVASLIFLVASFLPQATVSARSGLVGSSYSVSASIDAWHSYGLLGVLVGMAGIGLWVYSRMRPGSLPELGRSWSVNAAVLIVIGTVLVLVRAIAWGGQSVGTAAIGLSTSIGWGAIVLLIAGAVAAISFGTDFTPRALSK